MRLSRVPFSARGMLAGGLFAAFLVLSGCSKPVGTVSGKVSYKGKEIKGGSVALVNSEGKSVMGSEITEEGTYKFENVVAGDYKVLVDTSRLAPVMMIGAGPGMMGGKAAPLPKGAGAPPPGVTIPEGYKGSNPADIASASNANRYTEIPPNYRDAAKTDLTMKVVAGDQTQDITLK